MDPLATGKSTVGNLDFNLLAAAGYLPFFGLNILAPALVLVTEPKESKFLRFHAIQSLLLTISIVVGSTVFGVIAGILPILASMISDNLAMITSLLATLLLLVIVFGLIAVDFGMAFMAFRGSMMRIPVLGQIADKISG